MTADREAEGRTADGSVGATAGLAFSIGGLTTVYALPVGSPAFVTATLCGLVGAFAAGRASAGGAARASLTPSGVLRRACAGCAIATGVAVALLSSADVPVPGWAVDACLASIMTLLTIVAVSRAEAETKPAGIQADSIESRTRT